MKIPLGKDAVVEVEDGYNYTLKTRHVVEKTGVEVWRGAGYFNSLESAVAKAVMAALVSEDAAAEARALVKGIYRTVCEAREVTRDLRANLDDLRELKTLLEQPSAANLEKARQLVGRSLS